MALANAKPSLNYLKNRCSWNPRPGTAVQLLVADPTATHALRKSLLDCNTFFYYPLVVLKMICFTELPAKPPPSRQSSPEQRVLSSNPSVRWAVPVYALHAPTNLYLLSPRINTYRTYMPTRPTYIHSCIHIYMYRHKYTHTFLQTCMRK